MKEKKNFLLLLGSIFLSLLFVEIFFSVFYSQKNITKLYERKKFNLYEQGKVFKNEDDFFKYHSNKKILTKAFYEINQNYIEEYSYYIETNNFGLVQVNDIQETIPSILFLGDSFAEGQGGKAWINKFGGKYKDLQTINGGIFGTGPQQFHLMEKHISKKYNIIKVVVLYIGDDFRRNVWNMPSKTFVCLNNQTKCIGDEAFYGYEFGDGKEKIFLKKISKYRKKSQKMSKSFKKFKRNTMNFILDLNIVYYPKNTLKKFFYTSNDAAIKKNTDSLNSLNKKYEDNIIFIQLFTKDEILYGKSYETFHAERYLKTITENHFVCDFEKNINFFYKYDRHPNNLGYDYLFNCVREILNKF